MIIIKKNENTSKEKNIKKIIELYNSNLQLFDNKKTDNIDEITKKTKEKN